MAEIRRGDTSKFNTNKDSSIDKNKVQTKDSSSQKSNVKKKEEPLPFPADYNPKKVSYPYISKRSLRETLADMIPDEFIPTKILGYIFSGLFLITIVLSLFFVPFGEVLKGNVSINVTAGLPMHVINLDLAHPEVSPVRSREIIGLFVDALVFLLIGYIINIILNYAKKAPILVTRKDEGKYPKLYKEQNPTIAEKTTEKIFKDDKKDIKNQDDKGSSKVGKPLSKPLNLKPVDKESNY